MYSDAIMDDEGKYDKHRAKFYLILNGDFKVSTPKFNKSKHKKKELGAKKDAKPDSFKKILRPGDYFGEVSFLFDCRRTSTIKAKLYATIGALGHESIKSLLQEYPVFRQHLKNDVVKVYDDDLKLFLMHALRRIDYLAHVKEEVIV